MRKLVMTRLVLPFVFVVVMISIPFVWFPEVESPPAEAPVAEEAPSPAASPAGREPRSRPGPLQRTMTLGFALILVSVTLGGAMLYGITRRQTVSFRRRFAPKKANEPPVKENPPPA